MAVHALITGGAGYIGSALAEVLIREGYDVTIVDSLRHGNASVITGLDKKLSDRELTPEEALYKHVRMPQEYPSSSPHFRFAKADTRDKEMMERVFTAAAPEVVFHFAEIIGYFACEHNPQETREINYDGSRNIIDLAIRNDARLVWNSSSSVYSFKKNPKPLSEEEAWSHGDEPVGNYCLNKKLIERYIAQQAEEHPKFEYVIFRPATVGGIGLRTRIDLLPNQFPFAAMTIKRISLAQPEDWRAFVHVEGLVECYRRLLLPEQKWQSGTYNVGSINLTKREFAEYVRDKSGCKLAESDHPSVDMRSLSISSARLQDLLGFAPEESLETIVDPLIAFLHTHPDAFSSVSGGISPIFMNTPMGGFMNLLKG